MTLSRNPNLGLVLERASETEGYRLNCARPENREFFERLDSFFTGKSPEQCPGYDGYLRSLPAPNLAQCGRQAVRDYFDNGWTLTEMLFSALKDAEGFYRPPYHGLRHPLIFYYVHPAVLYINKLRLAKLIDAPIDAYFESLFETGVDEMSWDDMSKNEIEWPTLFDAHAYRRKAYAKIAELIESHPELADGHQSITMEHPLWALFMGFEHERIHLETSSVLMRELPVHLLERPAAFAPLAPRQAAASLQSSSTLESSASDFQEIEATSVRLGKPKDHPSYGWDNEYGKRSINLRPFQAGRSLITNADFLAFVEAGGYFEDRLWSETGRRWKSFRNVKFPTFWVPDGPAGSNQFKLRTIFEVIDMPLDWPCLVNYHEAKAFCRWRSEVDNRHYRLPSEAEHQAMRRHESIGETGRNLELQFSSESSSKIAAKQDGIAHVFGNVWQWLEDHFNPLEGAKVHRLYDDFSTPCYDGQHQMIMGGSFISTGDEAGQFARFHFRPHFFQHAGFRLVLAESDNDGQAYRFDGDGQQSNPYETLAVLNEYMTLHYAAPETQLPFQSGPQHALSFPQRTANLLIDFCRKLDVPMQRALDIGCAVGGSSFALASAFEKVVGVDLSKQFIDTAQSLKENLKFPYQVKIEGDIYEEALASVEPGAADRVEFRQADACSLPAEFIDFDAVLIANLLCRLPSPGACLGRLEGMRGLLRSGGIVVIVSPYTWMEKFTPREVWLGGYYDDDGKPHFSQDGIKAMLGDQFQLLHRQDMPLLIREHRRKYQYIVSDALVFQKR